MPLCPTIRGKLKSADICTKWLYSALQVVVFGDVASGKHQYNTVEQMLTLAENETFSKKDEINYWLAPKKTKPHLSWILAVL